MQLVAKHARIFLLMSISWCVASICPRSLQTPCRRGRRTAARRGQPTMSEAELHLLQNRLRGCILNKARRDEPAIASAAFASQFSARERAIALSCEPAGHRPPGL